MKRDLYKFLKKSFNLETESNILLKFYISKKDFFSDEKDDLVFLKYHDDNYYKKKPFHENEIIQMSFNAINVQIFSLHLIVVFQASIYNYG